VFEKFFRLLRVFDDVKQFAQPAVLQAVGALFARFVGPMRGDAEFRNFVHAVRADLNFNALALGPMIPDAGFDTAFGFGVEI